MRQPSDHQPRHRHIHERFAGFGQPLVIFAQAAILPQPRQRALDNPALGQHMKAAGDGWRLLPGRHPHASEAGPPMLDDLDIPSGQVFGRPTFEPAVVVAVGPQLAETRKPFRQAVEDLNGTIAVGQIGRMHLQRQHQALRIHEEVAFAPLDLLTAVITTRRSTDASGFDTLTIDDRRTRLHIAAETGAQCFAQGGVDGFPHPQQSPQPKVVEDRFPLGEVVRQPL
jgi:hypothetical protein